MHILFLSLCLAAFIPQESLADGDGLLQIAAKTRQIEAATNNQARLYLERGELHREHKYWEPASADYDLAEKLGADPVDVDLRRASLLYDTEKYEAARAMFSKVVAAKPGRSEGWIGRAQTLVRLGLHDAAVSDFRRGLELVRMPPVEHFRELAEALMVLKRTDEALRALDGGIKKLGPIVPLQGYAVEIEVGVKNYDRALARLDAMLEIVGRKETWLARRGEILVAAGRLPEAKAAFESALMAIGTLPARIQEAPPMQDLHARIDSALVEIATKVAGSEKGIQN